MTTVLVLYLCIKVPLVMGFDWWKYPPALTVLDYLIDAWFCIDIVLNFRTGYMHDGKVRWCSCSLGMFACGRVRVFE